MKKNQLNDSESTQMSQMKAQDIWTDEKDVRK